MVMNYPMAFLLLIALYLAIMLIWGYEDRRKYEIKLTSVLAAAAIFVVAAIFTVRLAVFTSILFAAIGIIMAVITYTVLRRQLAPLDMGATFMGYLTVPFIAIPAFVMSMGLTIFFRRRTHAYLWVYALSCTTMALIEVLGLAMALHWW
jgi:hypothetical protein